MKRIKGLLVVGACLLATVSSSQSVSSVYSNNGIGLPYYNGLPNNFGMGEVGLAVPEVFRLNYVNPAFLPLNTVTVFNVGMEMDRRQIASTDLDSRKVSGGLRYLSLAFPVVGGKWSTGFALTPFTTVSTNTFSVKEFDDETIASTTYQGVGGLSSVSWSNGFAFSRHFFAGFRTSFIFGSIEDTESSVITGGLSSYDVTLTDRTNYTGFRTEVALGYRKLLNEDKVLNFGLLYQIGKDLNGSRDQWTESSIQSRQDRLVNQSVDFRLPSSIGLGMSYQVVNVFRLGTDLTYTNWRSGGDENLTYLNTFKIAVGADWTPEYDDVNQYFKRMTYRLGFNVDRLPYEINGSSINEVGINFGMSLPVRFSSIDLAFKAGRLGTLNNDLIRETYFRMLMGITINDRWFIKRRYD